MQTLRNRRSRAAASSSSATRGWAEAVTRSGGFRGSRNAERVETSSETGAERLRDVVQNSNERDRADSVQQDNSRSVEQTVSTGSWPFRYKQGEESLTDSANPLVYYNNL